MSPAPSLIQRIIEAALLVAGRPLSTDVLMSVVPEGTHKEDIQQALQHLMDHNTDRGVRLVEGATGWRFEAQGDVVPYLQNMLAEKPPKYSRALLETLALVAYRQPITRGEIESVRGVVVSTHIIKTLLEHQWVRVVGHKDVPGKPALYATTPAFLEHFQLKTLEHLPPLPELPDRLEQTPMVNEGVVQETPEQAKEASPEETPASEAVTLEEEHTIA